MRNSDTGWFSIFEVVVLDVFNQTRNTSYVFISLPYSNYSVTDLLWSICPYYWSLETSSSGDATLILGIVLPTVLVVILLCLCLAGFLVWFVVVKRKKRRRYYDAKNPADSVGDLEMECLELKYREVDYKDLVLGKLLGKGAFGKVYKVSKILPNYNVTTILQPPVCSLSSRLSIMALLSLWKLLIKLSWMKPKNKY